MNKKNFQTRTLLEEAAQLKIYGGVSVTTESQLKIYLGKGCKIWGDCKQFCGAVKEI